MSTSYFDCLVVHCEFSVDAAFARRAAADVKAATKSMSNNKTNQVQH